MSSQTRTIVLLFVGIVVLMLVLRYAGIYFVPFVVALFFAAVIDPLVARLEYKGLSRSVAVLLVISCITLILFLLIIVVTANISRELALFAYRLPEYARLIEEHVGRAESVLVRIVGMLPSPLQTLAMDLPNRVIDGLSATINHLFDAIVSLPRVFAGFLVMVSVAYFLSRDQRTLSSFFTSLFPKKVHGELGRLKREIGAGFVGYVKAQSVLVVVSGVVSTIGFVFLRLPYAWGLGAFAAFLDLLPVVGPAVLYVPLIIISAVNHEWWRTAGIVSAWVVLVVVRQTIEPALIKKHVGIHPITSIVSVYFGGRYMGVAGLFLGPIFAVFIKSILATIVIPRLKES